MTKTPRPEVCECEVRLPRPQASAPEALGQPLPPVCLLCGESPVEASLRIAVGPVPSSLKRLAPLANVVHPARDGIDAPLCPPCQRGYQKNRLLVWVALLVAAAAAGAGLAGLATGAPFYPSLGGLLLGLLVPLIYLSWAEGPGRPFQIQYRERDAQSMLLLLPHHGFPQAYRAAQRGGPALPPIDDPGKGTAPQGSPAGGS